jgi:hypothetical protein
VPTPNVVRRAQLASEEQHDGFVVLFLSPPKAPRPLFSVADGCAFPMICFPPFFVFPSPIAPLFGGSLPSSHVPSSRGRDADKGCHLRVVRFPSWGVLKGRPECFLGIHGALLL